MPAITGQEYLYRLRHTQPEVWIGGERVADITEHPATRGAAYRIAMLYDLQHEPENRDFMLFPSPTTGDMVGTQFLIPRNSDDLRKRYLMHKAWAEATYGMMGRTTDFCSAIAVAFAVSAPFFGDFAPNVTRYLEVIREQDLFLTHALIDPAVDRSKPPSGQKEPFLYLGAVRETDRGIIVRGAKMVSTAAAYANEIMVWPYLPLPQHSPEDAPYAIAFCIPTNSPGLRFVAREPYGGSAPQDHPFAAQFDELDTIAIFDDVEVPWERIFIYRDPERTNTLLRSLNPAGAGLIEFQTNIRFWAKLSTIAGLARQAARMLRIDAFLHVQAMLGELALFADVARAITDAALHTPIEVNGVFGPNPLYANTLRLAAPLWYPRIREILQMTFAGHLMYLPDTMKAFDSPIGPLLERYTQGADVGGRERVQVLKAIYDLAVHSFGGRHELYERWYGGDKLKNLAAMKYFGWPAQDAEALAHKLIEQLSQIAGAGGKHE
jgi:4-hydroxyphenylacetate 3-monooxygenase